MAKGLRVFGPSCCLLWAFEPWLWLSCAWGVEGEDGVRADRGVQDPAGALLCPHRCSHHLSAGPLGREKPTQGRKGMAESALRCPLGLRQFCLCWAAPASSACGSGSLLTRKGEGKRGEALPNGAGACWPRVRFPSPRGGEWDPCREGWGTGEPALHR